MNRRICLPTIYAASIVCCLQLWLAPLIPSAHGGGQGLAFAHPALITLPALTPSAHAANTDDVTVSATVEKETVSLGEPFLLQIQVEGADTPSVGAGPDMHGVTDFSYESLGSQSNNRSSITIINGKMNKVETRGYVHSYRLTPRKTGQLVIPPIAVVVASKTYHTQAIRVQVMEPQTTDDFQLNIEYSKTRFYVGEPITLTVTWYLGRDVETASFNLPVLENDAFTFADSKVEQDPNKQYFQIPMGQGKVVAEKGRGTYKGSEYTTIHFKKVLIAARAGVFDVPKATVSCKVMAGYGRKDPRRGPMNGFFDDDFFNMGRRQIYRTFVAGSEPATLTVVDLPEEGKPAGFDGPVGSFRIETSASPTEVSVGDPITLTTTISGSETIDNVELPPLSRNPELGQDFRIPEEMAAGVVKDGAKVFTQTLRAKSPDVKSVPPVKLAYFDPDLGRYREASSKPIPIQVKPARVVTSADIEGRVEPSRSKNELEAWSKGIAYNYEGPDVMEDRGFTLASVLRSPLWMAGLILPFSGFLLLLFLTALREKRLADPDRCRSRKALAVFKQKLKSQNPLGARESDGYENLLDAVRSYLGDKLRTHGGALTFVDMEQYLRERGVGPEITVRLGDLFSVCEQGRYGGGCRSDKSLEDLEREAREIIELLDRRLV
jgi:hypothetical protein